MTKDTETLERIRLRCTECGGCWLWRGAMSDSRSSKRPVMQHHEKVMSVRRVVAEAMNVPIRGNLRATNTCADSRCVSPEHLKIMDQRQIQSRASRLTRHQVRPSRNIKIQASRTNKILDWEKVAEIRSSDKSNADLAVQYRVAVCTIQDVRAYRSWRIYLANPFSGLMPANHEAKARA